MIVTLYEASVDCSDELADYINQNVPDGVWMHELAFARLGNCGSGSDNGVIWARFSSLEGARRCEGFLLSLIDKYEKEMRDGNQKC